jgi:hypothetical protein
VTELTRALFNISLNCGAEDTAALVAVAAQLDRLLNTSIDDLASRMSVHGGVINIVTNFEAMPAVTGLLFENNMGNVRKLLDFLIYKIENAKTNLKVTVPPTLKRTVRYGTLWSLFKTFREGLLNNGVLSRYSH